MPHIDSVRGDVNPPLIETNLTVVIVQALLLQRAGNEVVVGPLLENGRIELRGVFSVEEIAKAVAELLEEYGHLYGLRGSL